MSTGFALFYYSDNRHVNEFYFLILDEWGRGKEEMLILGERCF